jgi:two-component system, NarL family, sensor histidine kinase BarA
MYPKLNRNKEAMIDWELGIKLAGNKPDLARDILCILSKTLREDLQEILAAQDDPALLLQRIHKLHGAVSYCGIPRLKALLADIECDLKKAKLEKVASYLADLEIEVTQLLDEIAKK